MVKKKSKNSALASWSKEYYSKNLKADIFITKFQALYGTSISLSTFPQKKILEVGKILNDKSQLNDYISCVDHINYRRIYAIPNSKANAKLSLKCCFEGDPVSWDANQAYFKDGNLVGIVSYFDRINNLEGHKLVPTHENQYQHNSKTLKEIYKIEIDRVARELIGYKEKQNPFKEMVQILKANSPEGNGLHYSYRNAIEEILTD